MGGFNFRIKRTTEVDGVVVDTFNYKSETEFTSPAEAREQSIAIFNEQVRVFGHQQFGKMKLHRLIITRSIFHSEDVTEAEVWGLSRLTGTRGPAVT